MSLRRPSRFYRMRSATFTLLVLCGLSLGTGACGTILGAEDEYVVGNPAEVGGSSGAGLGGSAQTGGASGANAGRGGDGATSGAGQAGAASGQGGATAGQAGQAGAPPSGAGGVAGAGNGGNPNAGGFGGTATLGGTGGTAGAVGAGTGGASGAGTAGNVGTGGATAGASQGGGAGAGQAGSGQGGAGAGGSTAGTGGGAGASGGSAGASGGTSGGAGGAGGASDPCCLAELATVLTGLEAQYKNGILVTSFAYDPPKDSACYSYGAPVENTTATIRFAAKSNLAECPSVAAQVSGYLGKGVGKDAASGACTTANTTTMAVNAAVAFCSSASKIVCNTTIVQGPDAITAAACTEATCNSCATAGTASVKAWLKAQDDYYVANGKFDIAMATPLDTACYDYTFVYKDVNAVKLAAAAKNTACLNFAGRTDGKGVMGAPPVLTSGVCSMPTGAAFNALLTDQFGVVGDCEREAKGPATIACEAGATPVVGTGSVARSACGPQ